MSPTPGTVECKELMLNVYASVLAYHSATYCSAPITSGKRYFDWLAEKGRASGDVDELNGEDRETHAREVVQVNRQHSSEVVAKLRRIRTHVIDPGVVPPVARWTQGDWLDFWEEVITRFAKELVFVDGWEYSYGSAHEFWFAHSKALPTLNERMQPLTLTHGIDLIQKACNVIRSRGASAARLESILNALAAVTRDITASVGSERRSSRSEP